MFNNGTQDLTKLDFCAEVQAEQSGEEITASVPVGIAPPDDRSIDPYDAKPFDLVMKAEVPLSDWSDSPVVLRQLYSVGWEAQHSIRRSVPSEWSSLSGHLTVSVDGKVVPGTVALQLDNHPPSYDRLLVHIVILALLFFALMLGLLLKKNKGKLGGSPGKKKPFDFKVSYVSQLTTSGSLLGTALAAGVLPDDTFFISKEQYASLNLLFGLIDVLAILLHNAATKGWIVMLAAAITLGAAFGEVLTMVFILREMVIQSSLPWPIVLVLQITLAVTFVWLTISAVGRASDGLNIDKVSYAI